ncbi:MAG: outer membrane beta-barrel protein [Bacteroidales bacterium]|nr:outer membrane beta-barrel protein [Bacteroidales bacterium]
MKRIFYFLILLLFVAQQVNAQNFSVKGRLVDQERTGLPNTTLLLLSKADSTMVNFGISDRDGYFEISNVRRNDYILRASYVGYRTLMVPVIAPDGDVLDLGMLRMEDERTVLGEVTIEGERISMTIRGDTIEYDALAFGVRPHEMVEDLLKRMPGIEVDPDGTIRAQGEQVRRVLVDGREFFGRDPQMATRNLPADAISKVHVFDERSEQSRFTGIDDGERERTMNLELKEEHKQGMFGNSTLGYGPDNKFQGHTNLNRFDATSQLSILGMGNNINRQGFSMSDYLNFTGGAQQIMRGMGGRGGTAQFSMSNTSGIPISTDGRPGTNGIMTSWAGGANMNKTFRGDTDLNVSYFYNLLNHDLNQDLERENFLPQGSYDFLQTSQQDSENHNHRLSMRLDHKFSERSSVLLTLNSSLNRTDLSTNSMSTTYGLNGNIQNMGEQFSRSEGQNLSFQSSLLWRQRLAKPGRTLSVGVDLNAGNNNRDSRLEAINRFFQLITTEEFILQNNYQDNLSRTFRTNVSYTEPLGNRRFLELSYRLTLNDNEVDQQVFDLEGDLEVLNVLLTNIFNSRYLYHRGGFNVLINRDMYNLTIGAYLQESSLSGEQLMLAGSVDENYTHLLPLLRFNYQFSSFRRLNVNFETSVQEPGIQQLQPILDNRDPLNLYLGNPDLEPSYRNRLTLRFNSFNPINSFGFFVFATAEYVRDAITNAVMVDENMIQTITPVNTQSNLNLMGNANVNFSLPKINSRMMVGSRITRFQSTNILNEQTQRIHNNLLTGNVRYTFRPGDQFDANLSASMNWQVTEYEFSTLEQAYLNQSYAAEVNWRFLSHYRLEAGFRYMVYEGRTSDFDQRIPLLELSFGRRFLRNNSGELVLSAYNLLNRELGVTQRMETNFLEQQVTNSLGRYFLLSFTYSLNRNLNVMEGIGGGGGRMRFH